MGRIGKADQGATKDIILRRSKPERKCEHSWVLGKLLNDQRSAFQVFSKGLEDLMSGFCGACYCFGHTELCWIQETKHGVIWDLQNSGEFPKCSHA